MANSGSFSVFVSSLLDTMGFSREMIDYRINNTKQRDVTGVLFHESNARFITGGKGEGTSRWGEGDIDMMFVYKLTIVTCRHVVPPSHQHTVFYADDRGIHCGYTRLGLAHHGKMDNTTKKSLICIERESLSPVYYLSSSAFIKIRNKYAQKYQCHSNMQLQPTSGPAQPLLSNGILRDIVYAFSHPDWPAQASRWANRCRRHGWPPESVVTAVVQCGCHVVPKGFKGSPSERLEWCFSFADHEKSIIQLFNLIQKQVYILLKIIANDLKKMYPNLRDLVTSYTMKTVALWQIEFHHAKNWDRPHLLYRLMEAIYFFKSCVEHQYLPAYFITENNLFDGKINEGTATLLSRLLNNLLSQGVGCVLTFPSIQQQLQIMKIPGLRQRLPVYSSGREMENLIAHCCDDYLHMDQPERHMLQVISLINSPDMSRHRSLTKGVSKIMKATLVYIHIAKVKKAGISNRRKYELYRSLLHIASTNIDTDRMAGRVKFAGVLHVLGKTNQANEILYSIKQRPLFGVSTKINGRSVFHKKHTVSETDADHYQIVITRLGRDKYIQQCKSLIVRYTMEEIDIVPKVIKYELFHIPETLDSSKGAYVDPDMLRYYLLFKCHTELGDEANAEAAFINLIRIATQERLDPYMEYREVALNVLGLCYMEKEDYLRAYVCFCRAMGLRPRVLEQKQSTSTPWHLAVLSSKLINRHKLDIQNIEEFIHSKGVAFNKS